MSVLTHLLPDSNNLKLENCQLDEIKTQIKLIVSAINRVVNCPVCNQPTHKIHSRYERFLADLPWADYSITLQLRVRKFFCINTLCKRRIFTERLTNVTAPWARRTLRLAQRLSAIALANGGAAGVRLSQQLGIKVSRNTLAISLESDYNAVKKAGGRRQRAEGLLLQCRLLTRGDAARTDLH